MKNNLIAFFGGLATILLVSLLILTLRGSEEKKSLSSKLITDVKTKPAVQHKSNENSKTIKVAEPKLVSSDAPSRQQPRRPSPNSQLKESAKDLKSYRQIHLDKLLKLTPLDEKILMIDGKKTIRKMVRDNDSAYPLLMIDQSFNEDGSREDFKVFVAEHHLVITPEGYPQSQLKDQVKEFGMRVSMVLGNNTYVIKLIKPTIENYQTTKEKLSLSDFVETVEEDGLVYGSAVPNDGRYDELWGMKQDSDIDIDADEAWDLTTSCMNTPVAVLDTGIDLDHPDLINNIDSSIGRMFLGGVSSAVLEDFDDDNNHGSHCAGTIGADGNNNIGVAGVCWQAKLVPIKVLKSSGQGTYSDIARAVYYLANDTEVPIINASLGAPGENNIITRAVNYFVSRGKGRLFVAAAGNDNSNNDTTAYSPANIDNSRVISVAALDKDNLISSFSNYGQSVDIAAPGSNILSTIIGGSYQALQGTSMATPHVAGMAALLWSAFPTFNADEIRDLIFDSADKIITTSKAIKLSRRANAYNSILAGIDKTNIDILGNTDLAATLIQKIKAKEFPIEKLRDQILKTEEFRNLLGIFTKRIFDRDETAEELDAFKADIRDGLTFKEAENKLIDSTQYRDFVSMNYDRILKRAASSIEINQVISEIKQGSTFLQIKNQMFDSDEFKNSVTVEIKRILNRDANDADISAFKTAINNGLTFKEAENQILESDEFKDLVTVEIKRIYDREPIPQEFDLIVYSIQRNGLSLNKTTELFIEGSEFRSVIEREFMRILNSNLNETDLFAIRLLMKKNASLKEIKNQIISSPTLEIKLNNIYREKLLRDIKMNESETHKTELENGESLDNIEENLSRIDSEVASDAN